MITFPNCKINLGLNVTRKREDGFHVLETVFFPVALKDSLEVIQSTDIRFQSTGLHIGGDEQENLCIKAYNILKRDFPHLPAVHVHLHKAIPMGAGLGGGSSDAAFMLALLNKKFKLDILQDQLLHYALELGSDCPFFIINQPCYATGRGEILEPVTVDLSAYRIVLVNPGIHVSTKDAFAQLTPKVPHVNIREIVEQPINTWKDTLINDFEQTVFSFHPSINEIKRQLYDEGALYASMSGTGSTVYGLFENERSINLTLPESYFVFEQVMA
jgi:4-diphosphocytidyl-2-C-methyl-D-erythritol kinase